MADNNKTALDDAKFTRQAKREPGSDPKQRADSLTFGYFNSSVSITVFKSDGSRVNCLLGVPDFCQMMDALEDLAKSRQQTKVYFSQTAYNRETRQRDIKCSFALGIDDNGICYIGVTTPSWNKPIRFDFTGHPNFRRVDNQGNPMSESDCSASIAISFARCIRDTAIAVHAKEYKHPAPRNGGNGNYNKGGYNKNNNYSNNNGSGNNNQNRGFDDSFDDII